MFEIFNQLRSDLTGAPIQPVPSSIEERKQVIEDVVNRLYQSAVPENNAKLSVGYHKFINYHLFSASLFNHVDIPLLSLIDSAEIPAQFKITDINDPRLKEKQFVNDFSDWIRDKLEMSRGVVPSDRSYAIRTPLDWIRNLIIEFLAHKFKIPLMASEIALKGNILFFKNEQKAKEGIKFALLHEFGHIYNDDAIKMAVGGSIVNIVGAYLIPIGTIIGLCCVFFLSTPVLFVIIPISIPLILLSELINTLIMDFPLRRFFYVPLEKRADDFAVKHGPDTLDGAIHTFKVLQQINKMKYEDYKELPNGGFMTWWDEVKPEKSGESEFPFMKTHPLLSERIAHFEAAKQQPQNSLPSPQLVRV